MKISYVILGIGTIFNTLGIAFFVVWIIKTKSNDKYLINILKNYMIGFLSSGGILTVGFVFNCITCENTKENEKETDHSKSYEITEMAPPLENSTPTTGLTYLNPNGQMHLPAHAIHGTPIICPYNKTKKYIFKVKCYSFTLGMGIAGSIVGAVMIIFCSQSSFDSPREYMCFRLYRSSVSLIIIGIVTVFATSWTLWKMNKCAVQPVILPRSAFQQGHSNMPNGTMAQMNNQFQQPVIPIPPQYETQYGGFHQAIKQPQIPSIAQTAQNVNQVK